VGTAPYRACSREVKPAQLGQLILELLEQSGPTGYKLSELARFREASEDQESKELRDKYFPKTGTTKSMARTYQRFENRAKDGQKSRELVTFVYDPDQDLDAERVVSRVKCDAGAEELGRAVLQALDAST